MNRLTHTAILASLLALSLTPAADAAPLLCNDVALDVTLAPSETDVYQVFGTLCSTGSAAGKTVQVLLHGSTYARYYWDFPYQPQHYSYVRKATQRGYATFNLDRIGNGASDRPDGTLVDLDANAFVVHQVVEALRAGDVGGTAFDKVIVVGHSMGSFTALNYAGTYTGEADGVILTGFMHDINFDFVNNVLVPALYPADFDPKFAGQFPAFDYLTTVPGQRGVFYYAPNADPTVVAVDESLKETTTVGELDTGPAIVFDPISFQVEGPVQVVIGEFDYLFCGNLVDCSDPAAVASYEAGFWSSAACQETAVIGDAGHDLNLQTNAGSAFAKMLHWADRNVGAGPGPAPEPCP